MVNNNEYTWTEFYIELADKLLEYKNNRQELLDKVLRLWDNIGMKMPKIELNNEVEDMDPFTIIGLFNKQISDKNKISIAGYFKNVFNIKSEVPENFDGIPEVNNLSATFYYFKGEREEDDIDNLWNLFEVAIKYVGNKNDENLENFVNVYNDILTQRGTGWNITMGLFWIRPYDFIGLSSKIKNYLKKIDNKELADTIKSLKNPPRAEEYLEICKLCKELTRSDKYGFNSLPELSCTAYNINTKDESNAMGDPVTDETRYWTYTPSKGLEKWDEFYDEGIMAIKWDETGDLSNYNSKDEILRKLQEIYNTNSKYSNDTLCLWQFCNELKPGDIVFAKKGRNEIVGYGIVTSDYCYDSTRDEYCHIRNVDWKEKGHWKSDEAMATKTLTDVTVFSDFVDSINSLFENSPTDEETVTEYPQYNRDEFLEEAYISEEDYDTLTRLLENNMNIIIQGAPGVGKTFISKRLAYSIIESKNKDNVEFIQFHQSYSYEEFIMGYRPTSTGGFEIKEGVFYKFCKKAQEDPESKYFFIIDEINRGNLSKIFGELFMLMEKDKRGNIIKLLYNEEKFTIPENVYIIGLMNTADRSLAMMDYALRRRFTFYTLEPAFESENFRKYAEELNNPEFNQLIEEIEQLNKKISKDTNLGEGFMIGHSYFTGLKTENLDTQLKDIIKYEITPLLKEYWFDEPEEIKKWTDNLTNVIT